ncbi:MAG TPA: hypothetical protein PKN44_10045 [Bacteroidales bacterium]|nr:hypothetical protein [Bacteroidales bacterium]
MTTEQFEKAMSERKIILRSSPKNGRWVIKWATRGKYAIRWSIFLLCSHMFATQAEADEMIQEFIKAFPDKMIAESSLL